MLQAPADFPFPGSIAMLDGLAFTVQRLNADGTATISREGTAASLRRDAPVEDLVDAQDAERNALLALTDTSEAGKRIALHIARHLRDANEVALAQLVRVLADAARHGRIPTPKDAYQVARLLNGLGWRKKGVVDDQHGRTSLYVRGARR